MNNAGKEMIVAGEKSGPCGGGCDGSKATAPRRRERNEGGRGIWLRARQHLLEELASKGIRDEAVLRAMASVPRHRFLPWQLRPQAYADRALPIGSGQTISQPYVVAYMTELLGLGVEGRVLEVGTGSGYQTAVLAELGARVYTVEVIQLLSENAAQLLAKLGYDCVELRVGDGAEGWPEHAPYDGILVTAAAPAVPAPLIEQLKPGGRLVIPLAQGAEWEQWIWLLCKDDRGRLTRQRMLPVAFVLMQGWVWQEGGSHE